MAQSSGPAAGPSLRLGLIGAGSRGLYLIRKLRETGANARVVAVCDAWARRCGQAEEAAGHSLQRIADYRRMLESPNVDAVLVATLDHWHAAMTIAACEAGKDAYVEKPMCTTPEEGLEILRAVRTARRVVQVGTQQRSTPHFMEARERYFDSGRIGSVHMVRLWWNGNRYYGPAPLRSNASQPPDLGWQAWLGPRGPAAWDPRLFEAPFLFWNLSTGGQIGGLLVHMIDVVHWFLGTTHPRCAIALGDVYQLDDGRDIPDNVNVVFAYPSANVTFESTATDRLQTEAANIVFLGSGGRLSIFRKGYTFLPADGGPAESRTAPGSGVTEHLRNWLEAVTLRRDPSAPVEVGHSSAVACFMAATACRMRERIDWRPEWEA